MPPNSEIEKLERRWRDNPKGTVFAPYAEVLRKNGDHALARDVLKQGLELHPDHIPGNIVLGRCCLDLGEDGPAEAAFAHVLDLDPENVIALKALADITERQGRLAEADGWLTRLVAVDPSNDEAKDQFARVTTAREAAAAVFTADIAPRDAAPAAGVKTLEVRVDDLVAQDKAEAMDRTEAGTGFIDDVSDVGAFADEALDKLDAPSPPSPPEGRVLEIREAESAPMTPVFSTEPEPLAGLESGSLDLSSAVESQPIADLKVDEEFAPPERETPAPARSSGPFAIGVENPPEIEIRASGASEFQSPDDSSALLDLTPGQSEFQVPDASADISLAASGKSEFQSPDASEELRFSTQGSSEYQTPNDAERLLDSVRKEPPAPPAPEPAIAETPGWGGGEVSNTLAKLAAMPTQELSTEPPPQEPSDSSAPSWFFEDEPEPAASIAPLPLIAAEPEPEPAAPAFSMEETPEPEPEPEPTVAEAEPEPVMEVETRSSAELKLIFPDDAGLPEPHRVRRITQAEPGQVDEAPEPVVGEPEPVMTESMAELYARQGHTAEALRVYRTLADKQPGDPRLRDRIRELEARSATAPRRHTYVAVDTGGESVESFFRSLADARPGSGGAVPGFEPAGNASEDNSGAPTRPARDPLSLSAIFGEEPAAAPAAPVPDASPAGKPAGPDAFSFDQFFGSPGGAGQNSPPARPSGASEEDLDQFQNWLKSLKR